MPDSPAQPTPPEPPELRPADPAPPPPDAPEIIHMKAECWYNLPEMVNTGVVVVGIWWWTHGGEWARNPLTLVALAFAVGFALRLLQLVGYSEVLNQLVFNTFGHNIVLWVVVIGEALWFIDQHKQFSVALGLIVYHLIGSNIIDLPGRMLVDRAHGGKPIDAFEAKIRARVSPGPAAG